MVRSAHECSSTSPSTCLVNFSGIPGNEDEHSTSTCSAVLGPVGTDLLGSGVSPARIVLNGGVSGQLAKMWSMVSAFNTTATPAISQRVSTPFSLSTSTKPTVSNGPTSATPDPSDESNHSMSTSSNTLASIISNNPTRVTSSSISKPTSQDPMSRDSSNYTSVIAGIIIPSVFMIAVTFCCIFGPWQRHQKRKRAIARSGIMQASKNTGTLGRMKSIITTILFFWRGRKAVEAGTSTQRQTRPRAELKDDCVGIRHEIDATSHTLHELRAEEFCAELEG